MPVCRKAGDGTEVCLSKPNPSVALVILRIIFPVARPGANSALASAVAGANVGLPPAGSSAMAASDLRRFKPLPIRWVLVFSSMRAMSAKLNYQYVSARATDSEALVATRA